MRNSEPVSVHIEVSAEVGRHKQQSNKQPDQKDIEDVLS
jgi:hypothetical protein